MSSFSVLGAPSKQIFEQVQPVPGFWEFPAEASWRAWQAAAGKSRTAVSGGRQQENEGDIHTALDLKCWQLLPLPWVPRALGVSKGGAAGEQSWSGRAGVQYRKGFRSRLREQRVVEELELYRSQG